MNVGRWIMGQIIRCPLIGIPCMKPITIQKRTFFLAEAEKPEKDKDLRIIAIREAIGKEYKIRSALEEKGINAFTCKICEMIQTCAYGIADITQRNANVLLELGMMIALGKPVVILLKKGEEQELNLPSDLSAIEIIPFEDYAEIIPQFRKVLKKLPPPVSPPSPIEDLEKIQPQLAEQLRNMGANIVKEFKKSVEEAKLDVISLGEEKKVPAQLIERIVKVEETLKELTGLGFTTDARTAFLRGNFYSNQGKPNEALAAYNWSLEINPNHPIVFIGRGLTYARLGRHHEALADYNRALELSPDEPLALARRSLTYIDLERYNDAFADANRALELSPDEPLIIICRGTAYRELKRYDDALADYNRALELIPNEPVAFNSRGVTYAELERYDEALADFNHSLGLRPDNPYTLFNLACLFSLMGRTDESLANLEKAILLDKENREKAKTDKDFDNIRDDPRFKKLMESD